MGTLVWPQGDTMTFTDQRRGMDQPNPGFDKNPAEERAEKELTDDSKYMLKYCGWSHAYPKGRDLHPNGYWKAPRGRFPWEGGDEEDEDYFKTKQDAVLAWRRENPEEAAQREKKRQETWYEKPPSSPASSLQIASGVSKGDKKGVKAEEFVLVDDEEFQNCAPRRRPARSAPSAAARRAMICPSSPKNPRRGAADEGWRSK